jgi:transmembrane sensor
MNDDDQFPDDEVAHTAAGAWWVKLDAGPLSREDRVAFEAWLGDDPVNRAAFDEVSALCGEVRAMRPKRAEAVKAPAARRARLIAAAALLAASFALFLSFDELTLSWRADFRTNTGESRIVSLDDGSRVHLAAKSAIAWNFHGVERKLTLLEGEAWFEASPNPARPFVVAAEFGTVTALGTAFDIALESATARVTVTEHRVAIASEGRSALVAEGQQSAFGPGVAITPPVAVDIDNATAWRHGKLIFNDQPLGEVMATLSRYHRGYFVIPTRATRQLRVTGVFDAADPLGALKAIEESLDLHAIYLTNYLVILHG